MERRRRVGQSAALVSSIVLVGGFIAFCSGTAVFFAGSKSSSVFSFVTPKAPAPGAPAPQEQPQYMSGSKSTFIFVGNDVKPPGTPEPAEKTPPAKTGPVSEPPR